MSQHLQLGEAIFIGEQDGIGERALKRDLEALLEARDDVEGAWLAIVHYTGSSDYHIALCILGVEPAEQEALRREACGIFDDIFQGQAQLDVLFPTDVQRQQLELVCRPFYLRDAKAA